MNQTTTSGSIGEYSILWTVIIIKHYFEVLLKWSCTTPFFDIILAKLGRNVLPLIDVNNIFTLREMIPKYHVSRPRSLILKRLLIVSLKVLISALLFPANEQIINVVSAVD